MFIMGYLFEWLKPNLFHYMHKPNGDSDGKFSNLLVLEFIGWLFNISERFRTFPLRNYIKLILIPLGADIVKFSFNDYAWIFYMCLAIGKSWKEIIVYILMFL